jgi:hypothetical protein
MSRLPLLARVLLRLTDPAVRAGGPGGVVE